MANKAKISNLFYKNKELCENISLDDTEFINSISDDVECKVQNTNSGTNRPDNLWKSERNKCSIITNRSSTCTKINTSLSAWGLPDNILSKYENRGITNMFKWQAECLSNRKLLIENRNLVYSAPTSAGKTLVAEILAIKTVLEKNKKVIIILPFVSVVREKMFYFQDILSSSGVRVEGFMGSHTPPGGFKAVNLAICTIEKANSIVNRLLEEGGLADVGAVVIDEIHLLADPSRGYLLELLLTKLRYMSAKESNVSIQLIGMSATLPNLELLSKWLDAELYTTDFRPIPLYEFSIVMGEIYDNKFNLQRRLSRIQELKEDADNILQLCLETISISCSVLIFCPTKNWCENLAQQISVAFRKLGLTDSKFGKFLREQLNSDAIIEVLGQLERCPVGLDSILKKTVSFGVAFHHAGLTMDERDIIEGAFRSGALRVLVATSTLSSGVNLPAKRVIIRTPLFHGKPIGTLTYRQMIGRAGRMGKDSSGESILVCQKGDKRIATELMSAKLHPINSCLEGAGKLNRAILEVIASGVATTPAHIDTFTKCTLLWASEQNNDTSNPIEDAVQFLLNNEFIRLQHNNGNECVYVATALGKACLSSSLPPEDGLILFEEIEKARQCFVLDTDLHLLYLVTPYSVCSQWTNLDWIVYLDIWEKLPTNMKRVGELVGVRESYIFNATQGKIYSSTAKQYHKLQIHRRFYTALALQDLVNEVPLNQVAQKFQCSRGMLQSLQQSSSMFAGMVTSFCSQLRWKCVEILIAQFQDRLQFGIQHELLDLMKLPNMNGPRSRALYNAGIETLADLASFDVSQLENILYGSVPFQSEKVRDTDTDHDLKKKEMRTIWISGKEGLTARQAAHMLIKDARNYLQLEMGAVAVKWDSSSCTQTSDTNNTNTDTSHSHCSSSSDSSPIKTLNMSHNENHVDADACSSSINKFSQSSIISKNEYDDVSLQLNNLSIGNEENNVSLHLNNLSIGNKENNVSLHLNNLSIGNEENDNEERIQFDMNETNKAFNNSAETKTTNYRSSSSQNTNDDDIFFEESLALNSRLCDVLDTSCQLTKHNTEKSMNDTFILESSFNTCVSDNEFINKTTDTDNNSSSIIDTSISEMKESFKFFKTINSAKKKKTKRLRRKRIRNKDKNNFKEIYDNSTKLEETPRKKQKYDNCKNDTVNWSSLNENIFNASIIDLSISPQYQHQQVKEMKSLDIVPVCDNASLFETFCKEIENLDSFSLAVACEYFDNRRPTIGENIIKYSHAEYNDNNNLTKQMVFGNKRITGVSLCWGENTSYYISFTSLPYVDNNKKLNILQKILNKRHLLVKMCDSKEQIKTLYYGCGISFNCKIEDPKVADWLLEPEGIEKNLQAMALKYAAEVVCIAQLGGNSKGTGSISLDVHLAVANRVRSGVESVVVWHVINSQKEHIINRNIKLMDTYKIEMCTILYLARMEITGVGVDKKKTNEMIDDIQKQMNLLEKRAFQLAGRRFSFTSSKDVAMVLGLYKGRRVSTNKQTLEQHSNPISDIVIEWRKLSNALSIMYPLIRTLRNERIHGCCITYTSTGRISMHEPTLQNVPRNFDIRKSEKSSVTISVRSMFVPTKEKIFLSADYCQLELRILTHLSRDSVLCKIMCSEGDVFRTIAGKLNHLPEDQVSDVQRQHAKQLCYGIIYGMGTKALSKQMDTSEEEADQFMTTFSTTYPSIKVFIQETVGSCRQLGYVETLANRRRYLPNINSDEIKLRSQAERQAVNTTIQGSAADIAKKAMIVVEENLHKHYSKIHRLQFKSNLVLHLHDELLYEVPMKDLNTIALLIKNSMEGIIRLTIPLPVKLKCGPSWGQLDQFQI